VQCEDNIDVEIDRLSRTLKRRKKTDPFCTHFALACEFRQEEVIKNELTISK